MIIVIDILLYVALNWAIPYFSPKKVSWLGGNFILTLLLYAIGWLHGAIFALILILLIALTIIFCNTALRIKLLTSHLMVWFQNRLPSLSQTEAEALETGDQWMETSLFQGKPDWAWLENLELSQPNAKEQAFIDNETTILCKMIDDWKVINKDHDLPAKAWKYLKDNGFCGLTISKEYGGKGFSAAAVSAIVQKAASRSFTAGVTVMVPNSLGLGELFSHFGTETQKQTFLPDLATGKHIACFALTGPETGSDASSIPDIGTVCLETFEGKENLGVRVNFNKRYITLAPVATLVGLAFKLQDPDNLLNGIGKPGITCCYIPREHPGLTIGRRHYPCGMPIMNGPIKGKDVFVPLEWIIGGQEMAGKGWSILISALSIGRAISLPAISQGITTSHYISTSAYAGIREQFGQSIGDFEGVQEVLARIGGLTYLSEATRALTYTAIDHDLKPAVASAIAKYHTTENCRKVINDALDIHGGRGVMDGPKNYLSGHYRGLLISITGEGANIITRSLIIYGQAMTRCHPYIAKLMASATDNNVKEFDQYLWKSVGSSLQNAARAAWLSYSKGYFLKEISETSLSPYYRDVSRLSATFALLSDATVLTYGGSLKQKETITSLMSDMIGMLYLASAVLKYHHAEGAEDDLPHAQWSLQYCLYHFQQAFFEVLRHFPSKIIAFKIRMISFPFGASYQSPDHELVTEVSKNMLSPSAFREKLKAQFMIPGSNIDLVEKAFQAHHEVASISAKLQEAIKAKQIHRKSPIKDQLKMALNFNILTQAEVDQYLGFWEKYWQAINVDDFEVL